MKNSTILWTVFLIAINCTAQQIQLKGNVAVHNSKYETGKVIYVEDAYIKALFTKPANTDVQGNFTLEFVGIDPGTSLHLELEKQGFEVVNTRDLEDVVLSRTLPIRIYVAKKGKLAKAQTELYNISKKALYAKKDALITRLRADSAQSKVAIKELEIRFGKQLTNRLEAENLLTAKLEAMQKRLPEFAQELAATNLDNASKLYLNAYEYFKQGDIEKVIP